MLQRARNPAYPTGFPDEIELGERETLLTTLEQSFARHAQRIAATCLHEQLSYEQLARFSRNFAIHLHQSGLQRGDRVALMIPNSLPYLIALAGVIQAGMVVVNINPLYTPRELEHQLRDSGAGCIVIAEPLLSTLEPIIERTAIRQVLATPVIGLLEQIVSDHALAFATTLKDRERAELAPMDMTPADIAFLQYTGGTTGVSKGAVLTHRSVGASLKMILLWLTPDNDTHPMSIVLPLPLYHVYPMSVALMSIALGANLRLIPNPRDTASVINELKRAPFDMFMGVNTLFNSLVEDPQLKTVDFTNTYVVIGAGASVQQAVVERWIAAGGAPITEAYGLTETSPCMMFNPRGRNGSIGIAMPSTELRIVDDEGVEVPSGGTGELHVKGPQLFAGYWKNEDETRKAFTGDGWFKTGDIVSVAEDGFMHLVDRKKDMILVSGFNVYPNEIEDVVANHPDILECACIGVPDERSGEVPHLFAVARTSTVTVEQIKAHCRSGLTGYKVPKYVTFVEALPKSSVGKILRKDLRSPPGPVGR
ncbi:long-chain-fatty-acid--CoA ligase [Pseudomonas batumici]|uniref:Long-chain-fatty-acid--CoA ligase n=1 Tax=Pseudomonas batumici TaxID=226910 RepID=A0A0C2I8V0_9PSED|nr:long-chain-fatty-acid--CoA ligase [Pseudomonas batumici]KIH83430.1 Long-chain-fatty-acid--CoA ligase [Pseudomonas batumici]